MVFSIYELITAFTAGLFLLYLLTFFLKLKRKLILLLAANSLIGSAVYIAAAYIWGFSATAVIDMFLCGLSGVLYNIILLALNIF